MDERSPNGDTTGPGDEARAPNDRTKDAPSAERDPDGMRIEIGDTRGGYIEISAGRTLAALVAVAGAITIVAILAYPRLPRAVAEGAGSRDDAEAYDSGREYGRTDGTVGDASDGSPGRRSASADPER